jgi:hypothetical protein
MGGITSSFSGITPSGSGKEDNPGPYEARIGGLTGSSEPGREEELGRDLRLSDWFIRTRKRRRTRQRSSTV